MPGGKKQVAYPSDGLRHMSCRRGRSGTPQKAKGNDLCSIEIQYGGGLCFPQLAATSMDGLRTTAMRWREVASTSENSSWNSQMPQLPQHPFRKGKVVL